MRRCRYVGFCVLEGSEAVLVTDKHLCVHCFHTHQVVWELGIFFLLKKCSIYLLYWCKSTKTDAEDAAAVGKITSVAVAERAVSVEASEKPVKQAIRHNIVC